MTRVFRIWALACLALAFSVENSRAQGVSEFKARALIEPKNTALLSSELAGKITEMPFSDGDIFNKGDLLVSFDCRAFKAQLAVEDAGYLGAQKKLMNLKRLYKLGSAAQLDIDLANSDVQRSKGLRQQAEVLTQQCKIKAPFSGKVVVRHARRHESVSPGDPIVEILNHENLEIKLVVPSNWLRWIEVGLPFKVKIDETGYVFQATIERIGARIDPVSQTVNIMARPEKADNLLPGMSGNALFNKNIQN